VRIKLLDAHCHLDLYPSYETVVTECIANHVRVLAVTTTPRAFEGNLSRTNRAPMIDVALGIHPQVVGTPNADIALFRRLLPMAQFVGEVGLDASPAHYRTFADQQEVFAEIIRLCVEAGGRPMSVHGVRSTKQVLSLIDRHDPARKNRYALHWFTGVAAELRAASGWGCYFSVNAAMFRTPRGRTLISIMPPESVLTETDGPFVLLGSEPLRPVMVIDVLRKLAAAWNISHENAAIEVAKNFERFSRSP